MCKYNFTYAHRNIMAIPVPIVTKFKSAQKHDIQMPYTEFHLNGTIIVIARVYNHLCLQYRVAFTMPLCAKLTSLHYFYVDTSCSKFYLDWTRNVENMGRISFMHLNKISLQCINVHETQAQVTTLCKTSILNYIQNLINSAVTETRS
jgi:hypothetical protein